MKKNVGRVFGPLGALFLLFAAISYLFIAGSFNWMVWTQLSIGVALVAAYVATALEDLQNIATGRGSVFVVTNAVAVGALIALLAGVNYKIYKSGIEWDMTKDKIHTLAEQTQSLVKALNDKDKVMVYAFYQEGERGQAQIDNLLHRYKILNPDHFDYKFVDFYKEGALAQKMHVTQNGPRIILKAANGKEARAKEPTEEALTNALSDLGKGVDKKVYFLSGDGEKPTTGDQDPTGVKGLADQLKNEGFSTADLSLLSSKDVPSDAAAVIIAGPQTTLMQGEIDALKKYADDGGRLGVFIDPGSNSGLDSLVKSWGADPMSGVILDTNTNQAEIAIGVPADRTHPITKGAISFLGMVPAVFADARGVRKGNAPGYTVTELYQTTTKAWSEGDPIDPTGQRPSTPGGPNDVAGPVPLGVAISKKDGSKEMRAVVFGDSDFLSNRFLPQAGNRDLALNIVQWLGGNESKITIRPRLREGSTITLLTKDKLNLLTFGSLNLLPLALIAMGLTVWSIRKSK